MRIEVMPVGPSARVAFALVGPAAGPMRLADVAPAFARFAPTWWGTCGEVSTFGDTGTVEIDPADASASMAWKRALTLGQYGLDARVADGEPCAAEANGGALREGVGDGADTGGCVRFTESEDQPRDEHGRWASRLAGQEGTRSVEPATGMVAWTGHPESGQLERVRIHGPGRGFDNIKGWKHEWLTGPDKGKVEDRYGKGYHARDDDPESGNISKKTDEQKAPFAAQATGKPSLLRVWDSGVERIKSPRKGMIAYAEHPETESLEKVQLESPLGKGGAWGHKWLTGVTAGGFGSKGRDRYYKHPDDPESGKVMPFRESARLDGISSPDALSRTVGTPWQHASPEDEVSGPDAVRPRLETELDQVAPPGRAPNDDKRTAQALPREMPRRLGTVGRSLESEGQARDEKGRWAKAGGGRTDEPMQAEDFVGAVADITRDREVDAADLIARAGTKKVLVLKKPGQDIHYIVHPATEGKGKYQVSIIDAHGPVGHSIAKSRDAALRSLSGVSVGGDDHIDFGPWEIADSRLLEADGEDQARDDTGRWVAKSGGFGGIASPILRRVAAEHVHGAAQDAYRDALLDHLHLRAVAGHEIEPVPALFRAAKAHGVPAQVVRGAVREIVKSGAAHAHMHDRAAMMTDAEKEEHPEIVKGSGKRAVGLALAGTRKAQESAPSPDPMPAWLARLCESREERRTDSMPELPNGGWLLDCSKKSPRVTAKFGSKPILSVAGKKEVNDFLVLIGLAPAPARESVLPTSSSPTSSVQSAVVARAVADLGLRPHVALVSAAPAALVSTQAFRDPATVAKYRAGIDAAGIPGAPAWPSDAKPPVAARMKDGSLLLLDGHHRVDAAGPEGADLTSIPVVTIDSASTNALQRRMGEDGQGTGTTPAAGRQNQHGFHGKAIAAWAREQVALLESETIDGNLCRREDGKFKNCGGGPQVQSQEKKPKKPTKREIETAEANGLRAGIEIAKKESEIKLEKPDLMKYDPMASSRTKDPAAGFSPAHPFSDPVVRMKWVDDAAAQLSYSNSVGYGAALRAAAQVREGLNPGSRGDLVQHFEKKFPPGLTMNDVLDAMYRETQALLDANGVKEVVLYRGTSHPALTDGVKKEGRARNVELDIHGFSSFTTNRYVAERFGTHIATVRVPADRIMAMPSSFPTQARGIPAFLGGSRDESEVIVRSGKEPLVGIVEKKVR